jgi:hypothetical protein
MPAALPQEVALAPGGVGPHGGGADTAAPAPVPWLVSAPSVRFGRVADAGTRGGLLVVEPAAPARRGTKAPAASCTERAPAAGSAVPVAAWATRTKLLPSWLADGSATRRYLNGGCAVGGRDCVRLRRRGGMRASPRPEQSHCHWSASECGRTLGWQLGQHSPAPLRLSSGGALQPVSVFAPFTTTSRRRKRSPSVKVCTSEVRSAAREKVVEGSLTSRLTRGLGLHATSQSQFWPVARQSVLRRPRCGRSVEVPHDGAPSANMIVSP